MCNESKYLSADILCTAACRAVVGCEEMLRDIFDHLQSAVDIRSMASDPQKFMRLADNYITGVLPSMDPNKSEDIRKAQEIYRYLTAGKAYECVAECPVPQGYSNDRLDELLDDLTRDMPAEIGVVEDANGRVELKQGDGLIRFRVCTINEGARASNPVSNVRFYQIAERRGVVADGILPAINIEDTDYYEVDTLHLGPIGTHQVCAT